MPCLTNKHDVTKDSVTGMVVRQYTRPIRDVLRYVVNHDRCVRRVGTETLVVARLIVEDKDLYNVIILSATYSAKQPQIMTDSAKCVRESYRQMGPEA